MGVYLGCEARKYLEGLALARSCLEGIDLRSSFQVKYFEGRKYEAGPLDHPLSDFWNDYKRGAADFSIRKGNPDNEIVFKLYTNFGHHIFSDGWHSRDYVNGGILHYTNKHITNNELTIGGDFRFLGGKSYNFPKGEWQKNEQAVFIHDQYVLWNKWIDQVLNDVCYVSVRMHEHVFPIGFGYFRILFIKGQEYVLEYFRVCDKSVLGSPVVH